MNYIARSRQLAFLFCILSIVFLSSTAYSNLDDSKHSFTDHNMGVSSSCMYCHTPHSAEASEPGAPLWNRVLPHDHQFILYGDGSTSAGTSVDAVGINTKTCLSCHDESIGASVGGMMDMRGTHPIGFEVNTDVASLGSMAIMVEAGAKFFGPEANRMECGSCHDPHETAPEKQPFLRMVNTSICTDCHVNK